MSKRQPFKAHWTHAQGAPAGAPMVMTDASEDVGWGVLRRKLGDTTNDLREFMFAKCVVPAPVRAGENAFGDWRPTVPHTVLLPEGAPAELLDARRLAERYEAEAFVGIKDLACVARLDIQRHDQLLTSWQRAQEFARAEFCERRSMAVVAVMHVPARSGVKRDSHIHLVAPAREWDAISGGFGAFLRPFASDAGGPEIAKAWAAWP